MRKIIALSMIIALMFNLGVTANAAGQLGSSDNKNEEVYELIASLDVSEEIEDAMIGVIDSDVSEEILDNIMISSNDENVEVSYTVKYLGSVADSDNTEGDVYTLTAASQKTSSADSTEDNVYCWISMTWIDNFGPTNEIVSVSGGWSSNGRTLSNRQVLYGVQTIDGSFADDLYEIQSPTTNSYNYTPSKSLIGFSLRAYSWVDSAGYTSSIYCGVKSSVLD